MTESEEKEGGIHYIIYKAEGGIAGLAGIVEVAGFVSVVGVAGIIHRKKKKTFFFFYPHTLTNVAQAPCLSGFQG